MLVSTWGCCSMLQEEYSAQLHNGNFPRADFRPELFDSAILQKGLKVVWEQGMLCSCHDAISGQPNYNCPVCHDKGYVYFSPKKTRVLVTGLKAPRNQDHIGLEDMGVAYITPLSEDLMGFRDRITFPDFTIKYSETIMKIDPSTVDGQYVLDVETSRYEIIDVVCLRVLDQVYVRTQDFDISEDHKHFIWKNDKIPYGTRFSILYTTHPSYILINPIHELRGTYVVSGTKSASQDRFIMLPKQYQIKREDFIVGNNVY